MFDGNIEDHPGLKELASNLQSSVIRAVEIAQQKDTPTMISFGGLFAKSEELGDLKVTGGELEIESAAPDMPFPPSVLIPKFEEMLEALKREMKPIIDFAGDIPVELVEEAVKVVEVQLCQQINAGQDVLMVNPQLAGIAREVQDKGLMMSYTRGAAADTAATEILEPYTIILQKKFSEKEDDEVTKLSTLITLVTLHAQAFVKLSNGTENLYLCMKIHPKGVAFVRDTDDAVSQGFLQVPSIESLNLLPFATFDAEDLTITYKKDGSKFTGKRVNQLYIGVGTVKFNERVWLQGTFEAEQVEGTMNTGDIKLVGKFKVSQIENGVNIRPDDRYDIVEYHAGKKIFVGRVYEDGSKSGVQTIGTATVTGKWSSNQEFDGTVQDGDDVRTGHFNSQGQLQGQGKHVTKNFSCVGGFNNGKFHGFGRAQIGDSLFSGQWSNHELLHGSMISPDKSYDGDFKNLNPHGTGVLVVNGMELRGSFVMGRPHGMIRVKAPGFSAFEEMQFSHGEAVPALSRPKVSEESSDCLLL